MIKDIREWHDPCLINYRLLFGYRGRKNTMMTLSDPLPGFAALARDYKRLGSELTVALADLASPRPQPPADKVPLHEECLHVVRGGMVVARHGESPLFLCDEGDVLPRDSGLSYKADSAVLLAAYPWKIVLQRLRKEPHLAALWERLRDLRERLLLHMLAARVGEDHHAHSAFVYFQPGEVLIRQGEHATDVYHLFEGEADVLVDNVAVGRVGEGEVLGAIAVLTGSSRSATVRALTRCSAVRVPGSQFHHLIRAHPTLIQRLMTDMARQITRLNHQVVALSG
ncbi:Crp/Fnr family transcriptional regulator [Alcanivoracaceae bacterium MT1]